MTDDVRLLFSPSRGAPPERTNIAPRRMDERSDMADFLEVSLTRPLWVSSGQHRMAVETSLDTMTVSERVFIEIEMQRHRGATYSAEYDPL